MNRYCLAVDEVKNRIFFGTKYRGVFALNLGFPANMEKSEKRDILFFHLLNNYPNPFNQCTVISYQLSVISKVRLEVYNTLGQLVKVVVDEEKQAGEYRVQWDGKDWMGKEVASGVYMCRLRAGDFSEVRKMVVLR